MRRLLAIEVTAFAVAVGALAIASYVGVFDGNPKTVLANVTTATGQEAVNTREQAMKGVVKALTEISKATKAGDVSGMAQNAQSIQKTAADIPALFPAGTGPGDPGVTKTRALPEIWTKRAEFEEWAKKFDTAGQALVAAVAANDSAAVEAALDQVKPACTGCHKAFRGPED